MLLFFVAHNFSYEFALIEAETIKKSCYIAAKIRWKKIPIPMYKDNDKLDSQHLGIYWDNYSFPEEWLWYISFQHSRKKSTYQHCQGNMQNNNNRRSFSFFTILEISNVFWVNLKNQRKNHIKWQNCVGIGPFSMLIELYRYLDWLSISFTLMCNHVLCWTNLRWLNQMWNSENDHFTRMKHQFFRNTVVRWQDNMYTHSFL